jgi:hypothetical protein
VRQQAQAHSFIVGKPGRTQRPSSHRPVYREIEIGGNGSRPMIRVILAVT